MSDLDVKKKIIALQRNKFSQYGKYDTGETKETSDTFDSLLASLQKINSDLVSLSLSVEKIKKGYETPVSVSEVRDLLNHAIDAKSKIKKSTFKTFLPNELDEIKQVYGTIQQFLESIELFQQFNVENEKLLKTQLEDEFNDAQIAYNQDPTAKNYVTAKDLEDQIQEVAEGIEVDEKFAKSKSFQLYFNTVKEIEKLIENKLLRNEGDVTEYARQIGGSMYNWIHSHQNTEYI